MRAASFGCPGRFETPRKSVFRLIPSGLWECTFQCLDAALQTIDRTQCPKRELGGGLQRAERVEFFLKLRFQAFQFSGIHRRGFRWPWQRRDLLVYISGALPPWGKARQWRIYRLGRLFLEHSLELRLPHPRTNALHARLQTIRFLFLGRYFVQDGFHLLSQVLQLLQLRTEFCLLVRLRRVCGGRHF